MSSSNEATIGLSQTVLKYLRQNKNRKRFLILDIGSGLGKNGLFLKRFSWLTNIEIRMIGIDLWKPYVKKSATTGVYDELVVGDLRFLPFKSQSFDVILFSEVLEHLSKFEGYRSLNCLEKLLKKGSIIVLTLPQGYEPQEELRNNPFERHRSVWQRRELRELGYTVTTTPLVVKIGRIRVFLTGYGGGVPKNLKRKLITALLFLISALSVFLPSFSGKIIAYKISKRNQEQVDYERTD